MDEQRALAEVRKALAAVIDRRRASGDWDEDPVAPASDGAHVPDPALCPNRSCRRAGEYRPLEGGPCLNNAAERIRASICAKLEAVLRASEAR